MHKHTGHTDELVADELTVQADQQLEVLQEVKTNMATGGQHRGDAGGRGGRGGEEGGERGEERGGGRAQPEAKCLG